jgi:hypothetical protein
MPKVAKKVDPKDAVIDAFDRLYAVITDFEYDDLATLAPYVAADELDTVLDCLTQIQQGNDCDNGQAA